MKATQQNRIPSAMELRMGRKRATAWIDRKIEERKEAEVSQEQQEAEGDSAIMSRILGWSK